MCLSKRNLRMPLMNATLRLSQWLEAHMGEFPPHEDLSMHLAQEAQHRRVALAEADTEEDIATGFREALVDLERYNLNIADLALFQDEPTLAEGPLDLRSDIASSGSVYLRNTFAPNHFYHALLGDAATWVFVLENKTLAGREPRHATDAQTRPLVVCFFKQLDSAADELVVGRMDTSMGGMKAMDLTPAELALHLGYVLPMDATRSARETETLVEGAWLAIPRWRYTHEVLVGAPDAHTYRLTDSVHAEDAFWADMEVQHHTKYAIARHLERLHGWDRARLWHRRLPLLQAALAQGLPPWDAGFVPPAAAPGAPAPAAPGAPARGRGRGRARGRGRGRGRV